MTNVELAEKVWFMQILSQDLKEIIIVLEFTSEDRGKEND